MSENQLVFYFSSVDNKRTKKSTIEVDSSSLQMQAVNMVASFSLALLCVAVVATSAQQGLGDPVTYDEWYVDGLKAYSAQKWSDAVSYLRHALEDYNRTAQARLKCFAKCEEQEAAIPSDHADDFELKFFHVAIQRAACIENCKEDNVGARPVGGVPNYIVKHLEEREAYNYLQMSLYQVGILRSCVNMHWASYVPDPILQRAEGAEVLPYSNHGLVICSSQ